MYNTFKYGGTFFSNIFFQQNLSVTQRNAHRQQPDLPAISSFSTVTG